jgi:hypothetical protein
MKTDRKIAISKEGKIGGISYPSLKDICPMWSERLDKLRKQSLLHLPIPFSATWFRM